MSPTIRLWDIIPAVRQAKCHHPCARYQGWFRPEVVGGW